jgi:glyoxylase-like metal-dependent hydrolase (beta-lactamase superfamily II)
MNATSGVTEVSDRVYWLRGSISNCGLIDLGDGSIVLVDSLGDPAELSGLVQTVAPGGDAASDLFGVATHYHWDHTGGLTGWPKALGISTSATRERLRRAGPSYLTAEHADQFESAGVEPGAWPGLPSLGIEGVTRIHGSKRTVSILPAPAPAHTGSDCIVLVEPDGVLFCGDLWFHDVFPVMDRDGSLAGWRHGLDWLSGLVSDVSADCVLVPGHGVAADRSALDPFVEYLDWVEGGGGNEPAEVEAAPPEQFAGWARAERHSQFMLRRGS